MTHLPGLEKTALITDPGLHCYKLMPFGLKNKGPTYQRLVNKLFEPLIGQTMEVCVDDMIMTSMPDAEHGQDLRTTFDIRHSSNIWDEAYPKEVRVRSSVRQVPRIHD